MGRQLPTRFDVVFGIYYMGISGGIKMGKRRNANSRGERKMAILTAECNRAFVVSPEQSKKFLEHKCKNSTNKELLSKISAKIKDNHGKA